MHYLIYTVTKQLYSLVYRSTIHRTEVIMEIHTQDFLEIWMERDGVYHQKCHHRVLTLRRWSAVDTESCLLKYMCWNESLSLWRYRLLSVFEPSSCFVYHFQTHSISRRSVTPTYGGIVGFYTLKVCLHPEYRCLREFCRYWTILQDTICNQRQHGRKDGRTLCSSFLIIWGTLQNLFYYCLSFISYWLFQTVMTEIPQFHRFTDRFTTLLLDKSDEKVFLELAAVDARLPRRHQDSKQFELH